ADSLPLPFDHLGGVTEAASHVFFIAALEFAVGDPSAILGAHRFVLTMLLQCIVGPGPSRPLPPREPAWLTPAVVAIARRAYDERDFSALPILADALQEAGCTNDEIQSHCHEGLYHGRGCWVLDWVLGHS